MKKLSRLFLILSAGLIFLFGCSIINRSEKKTKQESSSSTQKMSSSSSDTEQSSSEEDIQEEDIQQIGNDEVGYVYVPADWVRFTDVDGGETYQYSAPDAYTIVTLFSYDKETLGVEQIDDAAAEQAATSYAYWMEETALYGTLTGAKTKIAGYDAYQVYANVKSDGKLLCAWIFVTEAKDKVYLVSLEGQKSDTVFLETLGYIESTWSAKKE